MKFNPVLIAAVFLLTVSNAAADEIALFAPAAPVKTLSEVSQPLPAPQLESKNASTSFESSSLSAASSEPVVSQDGYFTGVRTGAVLSGTVFIQINPDANLRIKKVAYYLNGTQAGKEYASPYTFKGSGGFNTTQYADGEYTLSGAITTNSGDQNFSYTFRIDNSGVTDPNPDPEPSAPQVISPQGRTAGGLDYSSQNVLFRDVETQGNLVFIADQNGSLQIIDKTNPAHPVVRSKMDFATPVIDIISEPGRVYVLERGQAVESDYRSVLWKINVSNPASPSAVQITGPRNGKGLEMDDSNIYILHNHEYSVYTCPKLSAGCNIPSGNAAYYNSGDYLQKTPAGFFSAARGANRIVLTGNYAFDYYEEPLAAPLNHLSEGTGLLFAALQNNSIVIYDTAEITAPQTAEEYAAFKIPQVKTLATQAAPLQTSYSDGYLAVLEAGGLIEIFDVRDPANPVKADSFTQSGVQSFYFSGAQIHAASDKQYRILNAELDTAPPPPPAETGMTGITNGQVVSGTVYFGPSPALQPQIRKVAYYLNGSQSGKVYSSPFTWGGSAGFDTRTLANGTYTISGAYTTASGDTDFSPVTFEVRN